MQINRQARLLLALQFTTSFSSAFFIPPARNSFGFRQKSLVVFSEVSNEVSNEVTETPAADTVETPAVDHDSESTTVEETTVSTSTDSGEESDPVEEEERFTVYVMNLPYELEDKELEEIFAECGTVKTLSVPRKRDTKEAKGFAFIDMNSKEEMEKAIEELNGREVGGRTINVKLSLPKDELPKKKKRERPAVENKMYVGNLPYGVSRDEVKELFSEFGTVADVFLARDSDGKDRGFGFVTLSSEEEATAAINSLNGDFFQGRRLTVRQPNPEGTKSTKVSYDEATRVYFGNLSFDTTTKTMIDLFEQHGKVLSLFINEDLTTKKSRGYGFAQMPEEDAQRAIEALNDMEVDGRAIKVTVAAEKIEKTRIYVGNLSFETVEDTLRSTFGEYGDVISIFFPANSEGGNRGFAILTMRSEDAEKAIAELNDTEVDGRSIKVNEAMPQGTKVRETTTKIYVGNLDFDTTEDILRDAFAQYGEVKDCMLPEDKDFGGSRGFGFVTMDKEDAKIAMEELDGVELDGRCIRVTEANGGKSSRGRSYKDDDYESDEGYDEGYDDDEYYDDN